MKNLLKISLLSTLFVLASCAHHSGGCNNCGESQCEMKKEGSKEQCNMKHDSKQETHEMNKDETPAAAKK